MPAQGLSCVNRMGLHPVPREDVKFENGNVVGTGEVDGCFQRRWFKTRTNWMNLGQSGTEVFPLYHSSETSQTRIWVVHRQ